jgi:hypothetical protein
MNKEALKQQAAYAASEAQRMTFAERVRSRSDQPFLKRLGKAAAGNLAQPFIRVPAEIYRGAETYSLMSGGYESVVYASESEVLKFNIRTLSSDALAVRQEAIERKNRYELCREYLGRHWHDTSYSVGTFLGQYAVVASQPRVQPEAVFYDISELLDYSNDDNYIDELENLFSAISDLHQQTGYYPDILGRNNIVVIGNDKNSPKLLILDTEPSSPENQTMNIPNHRQSIGQAIEDSLSAWQAFLVFSREQTASRELALL